MPSSYSLLRPGRLLACVTLVLHLTSTLVSAKLAFVGDAHAFTACEIKTIDNKRVKPIFEFLPNGAVNYVTYTHGEEIRPGSPDALKVETVNGADGVSGYIYKLEVLRGQDGGVYKCDYGPAIKVPLQYLTILHKETECPASLGPVNMGEKLEGACTLLKQGKEEVNLKWKITDTIVDSKNTAELNKSISELDLTATPGHNGAVFTCFMDDIPGVQPCSVTAEVNYPPQKVEIAPASQNKLVGKEATVTCLASDANPDKIEVAFKIKKGDSYEDADAAAVVNNTLKLIVDADYAVKCEASNGIMGLVTNSTGEAMIYKMVPASISSPLAQSPSPVEAGSQFNVTCEAEPKKATVTWTKNGQAVTGNDRTLTLTAAEEDLGAEVVCKAIVNEVDDDVGVSANLTLDVVWAAKVVSDAEVVADGVKTTTIVFSGNPTPDLTVEITNGTATKTIDAAGTQVTVTIVANETNLPISYKVLAAGNAEPVKEGVVEKTAVPEPTDPAPPSDNAGTIAGIIIAVILICICAALLVVMWKKNLLCPKKGSLDVEKGTTVSSDAGLSKPVELEEVETKVHEPVEETQNKSSAPLLDDDDIKKPPVENGQTEIIPTSFDDQPPPAPATPPPPPPPLASPE